jgi:hypothetical protein
VVTTARGAVAYARVGSTTKAAAATAAAAAAAAAAATPAAESVSVAKAPKDPGDVLKEAMADWEDAVRAYKEAGTRVATLQSKRGWTESSPEYVMALAAFDDATKAKAFAERNYNNTKTHMRTLKQSLRETQLVNAMVTAGASVLGSSADVEHSLDTMQKVSAQVAVTRDLMKFLKAGEEEGDVMEEDSAQLEAARRQKQELAARAMAEFAPPPRARKSGSRRTSSKASTSGGASVSTGVSAGAGASSVGTAAGSRASRQSRHAAVFLGGDEEEEVALPADRVPMLSTRDE